MVSSMNSQQSNESNKYALVVGVNQSINMPIIPSPLKYAESNAAGISHLLGRKACDFAFPSGILIGKGASAIDVLGAIDKLTEDKSENDLLLFYFVGHGYSVEIAGRVETYLVTSDFNSDLAINNPESYVSLSRIREKLSKPEMTASVICILDCCYAGAIVEPAPSEQQLAQSLQAVGQALQAFVNDIANTAQAFTSSRRTWVALASTGPEAKAYNTFMTNLIIDMLNGEIPDALDPNGNLTLLTLYNYLQFTQRPKGQDPIINGRLGSSPWVLAYHPQENKVPRKPEDFPQPTRSPRSSLKVPFDMIPSPAVYVDLYIPQVQEFLQKDRIQLQRAYEPDTAEEDQMQALGLMRGEHASYGTLLCFGEKLFLLRDEINSACHTRCIHWNDTTSLSTPSNEDIEDIKENLLHQFTKACDFLKKRLGIRGISPDEVTKRLGIPFRALEEALANALVHREYATESDRMVRTEGVQVRIFSDRVEITSPGGPPSKLDLEHPESHPRNPQIVQIFYLAGYVERLGTGLIRMNQWMQEAGLPKPDIRASQQTFTIVLYGHQQESASPRQAIVDTPAPESLPGLNEPHTQPNGHELIDPTSNIAGCMDEVTKKHSAVYTEVLQPRLPNQVPADHLPTSELQESDQKESFALKTQQGRIGASTPQIFDQPSQIQVPHQGHKRKYSMPPVSIRDAFIALLCLMTGIAATCGYIYLGGPLPTITVLPSTTIEIASDFPTTGDDAISGLPLQNGVQMAITEANNEHLLPGGYTLKLIPYDDVGKSNRDDPQVGVRNINQAIANNLVAGVIGPENSWVALEELPLTNRAHLAQLSPSVTYPCLTKSSTDDSYCTEDHAFAAKMHPTNQLTFFRLVTTDDRQGKATADYFFSIMQSHKVLLLEDNSDPYSSELAQAFQTEWQDVKGGQVTLVNLPQPTSSIQNYQNTLQKFSSFQPKLIYFAGDDPNGSYVLQALSNIPSLKTVPFAGADGIVDSGFLQTAASLHQEAPIYASLPIEDPGSNFRIKYNAAAANGNNNYRPYAATAYDCTMMLIQAIKAALQKDTPNGTQAGATQFREAVLQALRQLSYTGATGTHRFNVNGDTNNHTISFYQADLSTSQPSWTWLQQVNG